MSGVYGPHFCRSTCPCRAFDDPAELAAEVCSSLEHWQRFDDAVPADVEAHIEAHRTELERG